METKNFAGVLILNENRILLVQEAHKEAKGLWSLPLGRVENNESLQEGSIRETEEETGYNVVLDEAAKVLFLNNKEFKSTVNFNDNKIKLTIFKAKNFAGDLKKGHDILNVKWFDLDKVDSLELRGRWVKEIIDSLI